MFEFSCHRPAPQCFIHREIFLRKLRAVSAIVFLCCLYCSAGYGQFFRTGIATQPSEIPLLLKRLKDSKPDKQRINLLLRLSSIYIYRPESIKAHLDSARMLAEQAKVLSRKTAYKGGYNEALLLTAEAFKELNRWEDAKSIVRLTTDTTRIKLLIWLCDQYTYSARVKRETPDKLLIDTALMFGKQAFKMSIGNRLHIHTTTKSLVDAAYFCIGLGRLDKAEETVRFMLSYSRYLPPGVLQVIRARQSANESHRRYYKKTIGTFTFADYIKDLKQATISNLVNQVQNKSQKLELYLKLSHFFVFKAGERKEDLVEAVYYGREAALLSRELKNRKAYNQAAALLCQAYVEGRDLNSALTLSKSLTGQSRLHIMDALATALHLKGIKNVTPGDKKTLDSCVALTKEALLFGISIKDASKADHLAFILGDIAFTAYRPVNLKAALDIYDFLIEKLPEHYAQKGILYQIVGLTYFYRGEYDKAMYYALQAEKKINKTTSPTDKAQIYMLLGEIYAATRKVEKSMLYYERIVSHPETYISDGNFYAYINLYCWVLKPVSQLPRGLRLIERINKDYPPSNLYDKYSYYSILGKCYLWTGELDKAEHYLSLAKTFITDDPRFNEIYDSMGSMYLEKGQYKNASDLLRHAEKLRRNDQASFKSYLYHSIARVDTGLGNYKSAVNYLMKELKVNDSIFNTFKERHAQELAVQYETQKKEAELKLKEENIRSLHQQAIILNQKTVLLDQKGKIQQIQLDKARLLSEKKESDLRLKEKNIKFLNQNAKIQRDKLKNAQLSRNITIAFILLITIILGLLYRQYKLKHRSNRIILGKNRMLEQLVSEKDWLLKEVHHRVKNNLQTVISLLESQAAYLQDDALKAMENCQHRIFVMSLIHQKLYQSNDVKTVDMPSYIAEFVNNLADSFDVRQQIRFEQSIAPIELDVNEAMPLALILNEAVTNSIKYAFPGKTKGVISISLTKQGDQVEMVLADNGIGLENINHRDKTQTLGLRLIRGLSQDMQADISFENDNGTKITIRFTANRIVDHRQNQIAAIER